MVCTAFSEYEKTQYEDNQKNYEELKANGITPKILKFMVDKFKRPMAKSSKTKVGKPKGIQGPKAKFKLVVVPEKPVSTSSNSKRARDFNLPEEIAGFSCDVCDGFFSSCDILRNHQKSHPHMKQDKRHRCTECSYSSDNIVSLRHHLLTHSGEKPHACPHCPKRFGRKGNLHKHLLLHTGSKEHQCTFCGKRFTQKIELVKHERVHTGERPYRCTVCGKDFTQGTHLKTHLNMHTGQRPHQCPDCELTFNRPSHLNRHIVSIHTRVFSHNCRLCRKGFRTPGELKKHSERHH